MTIERNPKDSMYESFDETLDKTNNVGFALSQETNATKNKRGTLHRRGPNEIF